MPNPDESPLQWLGAVATDRLRTGLAFYAMGSVAYRIVLGRYRQFEAKRKYTVSVASTERLYLPLQNWILERLPAKDQHLMAAYIDRGNTDNDYPYADEITSTKKRAWRVGLAAEELGATIFLEGHRIRIGLEKPETTSTTTPRPEISEMIKVREAFKPDRLFLTADSLEGRNAVIRVLEGLLDNLRDIGPEFFVLDRWGNWTRHAEMAKRSLASVILPEGVKEQVVTDLERFLGQEQKYKDLSIPWHRGYLFYGPPGSGKTSLARALADHLQLDIFYVPLSSLENDTSLNGIIAKVRQRSILLLEDIDIVHAAHERSDIQPGVTLSGLLNILDGTITPHGMITIMTTNNLEILDPALTRAGRADLKIEIPTAGVEQIQKIIEFFLGEPFPLEHSDFRITPAEIVETIKRNLNDPEAARANLKEQLHAKQGMQDDKQTA